MTRMTWGDRGFRYFEVGVDRGVLYMPGIPGVPWNGLTSVTENPSGGQPRAYYIDGYKYANIAETEEFEATIEAFSRPAEFAACDGTAQIQNGLFATQQPRSAFGFSYRTLVGNGVNGVEAGYKIHLVYNALAQPNSRSANTLSDRVSTTPLAWNISTRSPMLTGMRPTAHLVIDSLQTPDDLLEDIEKILYGTDTLEPRLPEPNEMRSIFGSARYVGEWSGAPQRSESILRNGRTGEYISTNLAVSPGHEDPGSITDNAVISTNLLANPSPGVSGSLDGWSSSGGAVEFQAYSNFAPYDPNPDADGTLVCAVSNGSSRQVTLHATGDMRYVPTPGKWYGARIWTANDGGLPSAEYSHVQQLTFNNPDTGQRYVNDSIATTSGNFYSGWKSTQVGQAQAGDTQVYPNAYIRNYDENINVPAGKRLWGNSWIMVEGDTREEVEMILHTLQYWDGNTRPEGYNSFFLGAEHDSYSVLVPPGVSVETPFRPRTHCDWAVAMNSNQARIFVRELPLPSSSGSRSGVIMPKGPPGSSTTYVDIARWYDTQNGNRSEPFEPGHTYRARVRVELNRVMEPINEAEHGQARQFQVFKNATGSAFDSMSFPNEPGEYVLDVRFTPDETWTQAMFRLFLGTDNPLDHIYFDDFTIEDITEGLIESPPFTGHTQTD